MQDFTINNTTFLQGITADWKEAENTRRINGTIIRDRWIEHQWRIEVMTAAQYDSLFAFEGRHVTLTSTDVANRNGAFRTYYGAECKRVIGRHVGPNVEQVQAEFLVRI